jgi:TolB-like protein/Flp pilus assembly protein TadD
MRFLFDGHTLDIDHRELRRGAEPIALEPLVFDLLVYLVANRDRVVSKDNLLDSVWSGRIVSESALASRIAAVRRAIGDSGEAQKLIRTISRKGFRFVGEVHVEEGATLIRAEAPPTPDAEVPPPRAAAAVPLAPSDRPSIAVLPFANMSSDPEQEYFSDGMADDIITELSRDHSLFVIARNSSFTFKDRAVGVKQIASVLGVRYVLEGSTRRNGGQIRVNAQLIDAPSGNHLWARRYDSGVEDVFAVQDEIAADVVRAILPAVANAERQRAMRKAPDSLSAWEAWQRALWHWSGGDLANSRDFLERAIALDPRFAPPYAMLAWLHLSEATTGVGPPFEETLILAQVAARTAIELDHDSGIAHAMLAWVLDHQGKGGSALEEAETAINLSPNDPQGYLIKGHVLMLSGRPAEARDPLNIALRLDPHGPVAAVVLLKLAMCGYLERDYISAEATGRRVIRAWPEFPRPYLVYAAVLGQIGGSDEARAALDAAIAASPSYFKNHTSRCPPYFRPEDHEHLLDGLRKAGWRG